MYYNNTTFDQSRRNGRCLCVVFSLSRFLYYRLDGAWFEKTRVASQFKDQYMERYEHCKVTGVYVYPKKKEHHYRIEVSSKWDEWTSYCSAETARLTRHVKSEAKSDYTYWETPKEVVTVKCQCPKEHRKILRGDSSLTILGYSAYAAVSLDADEDELTRAGHRCTERCPGHRVDAGSANECVSGYFGPDGKLEVDWGTLRPISMQ